MINAAPPQALSRRREARNRKIRGSFAGSEMYALLVRTSKSCLTLDPVDGM
jgi:hypothetical protein